MRGLLAVLAAAVALLATGCADDCEVACGKLQFCELLPNLSLIECVDRCEARERDLGPEVEFCSDCLDQTSCSTIARQGCAGPCAPVFAPEGGGGSGGSGGSAGGAGSGGDGGSGGSGGEGGA